MRFLSLLILTTMAAPAFADEPKITWKKTVLDQQFRSEGVAVADVNKDGKIDVLNGEYWYEAPDWTPHEMQPPKDSRTGERNYSRSFAAGRTTSTATATRTSSSSTSPATPCYWMENPKGKERALEEAHHLALGLQRNAAVRRPASAPASACSSWASSREGKTRTTKGRWPTSRRTRRTRTRLWNMHPISDRRARPRQAGRRDPARRVQPRPRRRRPQRRRPHGCDLHRRLVGTAREAGRQDAVEVPPGEPRRQPVPTCIAVDLDGDGTTDVISTSAHQFGIWWYQQKPDPKAEEIRHSRTDARSSAGSAPRPTRPTSWTSTATA